MASAMAVGAMASDPLGITPWASIDPMGINTVCFSASQWKATGRSAERLRGLAYDLDLIRYKSPGVHDSADADRPSPGTAATS